MKWRRKLMNRVSPYLPERYRIERMRKCIRLNSSWPSPSLEIKIADSEQELEGAFRLVHDSYVKAGYMDPNPTGLRILPQNLLPQNATVVAKWDGKVVGTLSLIRDNPMGLPMEAIFDVNERRLTGRRLAEVSSLAIDSMYRGQVNNFLFPLFRFGIQYARHLFGVHEFVVATTQALGDTYLGMMCFEKLRAKPRAYSAVKDTVAVGLYLNFETADERWQQAFGHRALSANFHRYWTDIPLDPRNHMPKRLYDSACDSVLTPSLLAGFFLKRAQMGASLTYKEVRILMDIYPLPEFHKVLIPLQSQVSRQSIRLETSMKAKLSSRRTPAEVLNVSSNGLLLRTKVGSLSLGQKESVEVWLSSTLSTCLKVEVRWRPSDGLFGLHIDKPTHDWLQMVAVLEREFGKRVEFYPIAV